MTELRLLCVSYWRLSLLQHTPLNAPGIYIRTLIPDGPAASDGRLKIGDRILAVNGTSLIGADYQRYGWREPLTGWGVILTAMGEWVGVMSRVLSTLACLFSWLLGLINESIKWCSFILTVSAELRVTGLFFLFLCVLPAALWIWFAWEEEDFVS